MKSQLFNYKEHFSFGIFIPSITFLSLASYCFLYQNSIGFINSQLLSHPNSFYILGSTGILFFIYSMHHYLKYGVSKKNIQLLELQHQSFSFPQGASLVLHLEYTEIQELIDKKESLVLYVDNHIKGYEFFKKNFDSQMEYESFKNTMVQYCSHLTPTPQFSLS